MPAARQASFSLVLPQRWFLRSFFGSFTSFALDRELPVLTQKHALARVHGAVILAIGHSASVFHLEAVRPENFIAHAVLRNATHGVSRVSGHDDRAAISNDRGTVLRADGRAVAI